jgi:transcriptional regulator with XRE-family HTH domain
MDETLRLWGENIKLHREVHGLTQYELADLIGVAQPTVWRWERGQMEPRRGHKAQLASALHTDVRLLFPMLRAA